MGSKIKGGGRAVMSTESQEAIIDLLISIEREDKGEPCDLADLSLHDKKRTRKAFMKKLVRRLERMQLQQKHSAQSVKNRTNDGVSMLDNLHQHASSDSTNPNVRIELTEAIFAKPKEDKKNKSKNDKGKSNKKKSGDKFKIGSKRIVVIPRTTLIPELLKLSQSKLKLKKKPVSAFLTSESSSMLVELNNNLETTADGMVVYVSVLPLPTDNHSSDEEADIDDDEDLIDPLESVKRAYKQQELHRQQKQCQRIDEVINESQRNEHAETRAKLPVASQKQFILDTISNNNVVILSGHTGSGKSTQVPQYLLECQEQGTKRPYIVVTQPRKVAAVSLAHRVAAERGCPPPGTKGSSVGYIVRLDRRVDLRSCRVIYMTIGILLRMLVQHDSQREPDFVETDAAPPITIDTISHLIIDEVHERDVNTDFALTLLKGMMVSKKSSQTNMPSLILMSATASSELFSNYFTIPCCASPAAIDVPGKMHPVDIKWLTDCEKFVGKSMFSRQQATKNDVTERNGDSDSSNCIALSPYAKDRIDNEFIRALITKILKQQEQSDGSLQGSYRTTGAILVFLPGLNEINLLARCLADKEAITGDKNVCTILKLHSTTPKADQERVFQQSSKFKIVLSTNLAETSLTIPDITHVIDLCLVKESRYNSESRIKELVTVWTSHASMKQRAGRAGRTSRGVCWRLCYEGFSDKYLLASTPPEIVRTPLDELLLQVCLLYEQRRDGFYKADAYEGSFAPGARPLKFLSLTPTPPPETNQVKACRHLLEVEALKVVGFGENPENLSQWLYRLTPLGYHLSRLPMDVKVGKLLIIGAMLGCLENALTIAAGFSCTKSCFLRSSQGRPLDTACIGARDSLIENGFGGRDWPGGTVKGDSIALIAVHRAWVVQKGKKGNIWTFCRSHGLDANILQEIDRLRDQFRDLVVDAGLASKTSNGHDDSNIFSDDALLTSCCIPAGLYPNICTLMRPSKGNGGPRFGKLLTKENDVCRPSSDSFQVSRVRNASESGKDAYAVYHSKHKTIGAASHQDQRPVETFLSNINFISKFSLLLFGGQIDLAKNALIVDGWLKFKVSDDSGKSKGGDVNNAMLILSLRNLVDRVILEHVEETCCSEEQRLKMIDRHKRIIGVLRKMLSDE